MGFITAKSTFMYNYVCILIKSSVVEHLNLLNTPRSIVNGLE